MTARATEKLRNSIETPFAVAGNPSSSGAEVLRVDVDSFSKKVLAARGRLQNCVRFLHASIQGRNQIVTQELFLDSECIGLHLQSDL